MYKLSDKFILTIHKDENYTKNEIKNNKDMFITSSNYHEYRECLKNEYGPINMGNIILFIQYISELNKNINKDIPIVYYVYKSNNNYDLLNALFLFGCYFIIKENYSIEKVLFDIHYIFEFCPQYYSDCISNYNGYIITIKDCFKTIKFIIDNKYFDIDKFNLNEYLYYNDYQFRDMTIILDKLMAMSCPSNYNFNNIISELKKKKIKNIIRLNEHTSYDKKLFEDNNIIVHDLYFEDMTTPSIHIIKKFLNIISKYPVEEIFAIHCRAGIGRTGILICIYLILRLNFKPKYAITYLRIMRPGSIMHHQGLFLESINYLKRHL